eukprot:109517_1
MGNSNNKSAQSLRRIKHEADIWQFNQEHEKALQNTLKSAYSINMDIVQIISMFLDASSHCEYHVYYRDDNECIDGQLVDQISKTEKQQYAITVFGYNTAGKSALILTYIQDEWVDTSHMDATIEDVYSCDTINGFNLQICDTANQFVPLPIHYNPFANTDIFMVCAAINNVKSFEFALAEFDRIRDMNSNAQLKGNVVVIFVVNKLDVDLDEEMKTNRRKGIEICKLWDIPYVETSAKNRVNVNLLFKIALCEYWAQTAKRNHVFWNARGHWDILRSNTH